MKATVTVLDPGDGPKFRSGPREAACWRETADGLAWQPMEHDWHPDLRRSDAAVWYCSKCRRVERREVVDE